MKIYKEPLNAIIVKHELWRTEEGTDFDLIESKLLQQNIVLREWQNLWKWQRFEPGVGYGVLMLTITLWNSDNAQLSLV
jgi:hypothetical protein